MTEESASHCVICRRRFADYDTEDEDEAVATCLLCLQESHAECLESRACPCQAEIDRKKLKAWNAGVRGW